MTPPILLLNLMTLLVHRIPAANKEATPAPVSASPTCRESIEESAQAERTEVETVRARMETLMMLVEDTKMETGMRTALIRANVK